MQVTHSQRELSSQQALAEHQRLESHMNDMANYCDLIHVTTRPSHLAGGEPLAVVHCMFWKQRVQ